ncbi:MAG: energy-coupling factor transporter ATPase [Bacilli bacterium]|nr:energy-coupling factor transporter ATPase [Bacilli bacterium]
MAIIKVEDLKFEYENIKNAIGGVSLEIEEGEFVCIVGHNGSGKSTLAKLLCGLLVPTSGNIYIDNKLLVAGDESEESDLLRRKIGIVFQNPDNQFVGVTVKDDIAFGLENRCIDRCEMIDRINEFSHIVGMDNFLDRSPESLSGGEKQRVAIAGILACDTDIIILDEATSMLDPRGVREVLGVISNLKHKKTIINITHNLNEIVLADRVIVMNGGKIVACGDAKDILEDEELLKGANLVVPDTIKLLNLIRSSSISKEVEDEVCQLIFHK